MMLGLMLGTAPLGVRLAAWAIAVLLLSGGIALLVGAGA